MKPRPCVVEGRIEPRPFLRLCGTFDHRVIDEYHAAEIPAEVEDRLTHPEAMLTPEQREAWRVA